MKSFSLPPLVGRIFDLATEETTSDYAMILLVDGGKYRVLKNWSKDVDSGHQDVRFSIVRETLEKGNPLLTRYRKILPDFPRSGDGDLDGSKQVLCIPLIIQGSPAGVLYFEKGAHLKRFSSHSIETLVSLCAPINLAIKNLVCGELRKQERSQNEEFQIVGKSKDFHNVLALIDKVKDVSTPVFICGESGTGKELVAKTIHQKGKRKKGKFVAINCGAIPDLLLESELFGHTKGSFTGALRDKRGLIEEANGGTFFMDEIGDLSHPLQAKLLRLLQESEIRRIGENHTRPVDVRFISATNKNIENEIKQGRFREDLYYRLKIITIFLSPLRDRKGDILCLLNHFMERYYTEMGLERAFFSSRALELLMSYSWPGNARELQNEIQRCLVLCGKGSLIKEALLSPKIQFQGENSAGPSTNYFRAKAEFEKNFLSEALARSCYNRTKAATEIGLSRQGLFKLMKKHSIEVP